MSPISENILSFIKHCNLFTSPVNLRYKLNQDYNTFAGGLISIILIILLMFIFYGSWVSLIKKTDISVSSVTSKQLEPSHFQINSNDFMFAVGVAGINLSDFSQKQYFNISMKKILIITSQGNRNYYETPFHLEGCQLSHWEQLGPVFVQRFKRLDLSTFLCPPKNTSIEMGGKWSSEKFTYIQIKFDKCKGDNCKTQTEIDEYLRISKSFFIDFFYSNTLLNPDQTKPISMLLEDKDYAMCSQKLSIETNLYLSQYSMITDESIFPWSDEVVKQGYLINRAEREIFNTIPSETDPYYRLYLRKSDVKLDVKRKFKKIDQMLSYIGGLFGIIVLTLGLVLKYYGQCSFELQMCQKIFDYHNKKQFQEQSRQVLPTKIVLQTDSNFKQETGLKKIDTEKVIEPKDFGFFDFLIYMLVYVPINKIINIKWKKMEVYEESLEEMRYKLDISQLMEKLNFYDRSINALFDENQLKLLYLQDKFKFQEVREERKMLNFREGINVKLFDERDPSESQSQKISTAKQHKKSLKEIADFRSKKKIHTFLQIPINEHRQKKTQQLNGENMNENTYLTGEIKRALQKLDDQIEKGDVISTRIYNGLQYDLLEAYQKIKSNERTCIFLPATFVTQKQDRKKRKFSTMNSIKINIQSVHSLNQNQNSIPIFKESRANQEYFFSSMQDQ